MGWFFSRKPPHPLDAAALRGLEARIRAGEAKAAQDELKRARDQGGDTAAVRYLECLLYHQASGAPPSDLLEHLKPALADGKRFPEARLLEARLHAALGRFDRAGAAVNALGREKLAAPLAAEIQGLAAEISRAAGPAGLRALAAEADALAAELARLDLIIRWRPSDLARLDALLDEPPAATALLERGRLSALLGEIAVRGAGFAWRLALRPEDRAVLLAGSEWSPWRALRERQASGAPLYASLHAAMGSPRRTVDGVPGLELTIEAGAHPAVVADHAARALLRLGVSGLGVFRERPTPEGPLVLPLSFVDKGGVLRAAYIETRPWEPDRIAELRRFAARLRQSAARDAHLVLLAHHPPPPAVLELVGGRERLGAAAVVGSPGPSPRQAATPRSLDEPKLRWLEEKAEMMERLIRASLGAAAPSDLELVKKVQQTVLGSLRGNADDFTPKQWNALYGYGALYGRALARSFGGRWSALGDDRTPGEWEMLLPWGRVVWPIGRVVKLASVGLEEGDLLAQFLELKSSADRAS